MLAPTIHIISRFLASLYCKLDETRYEKLVLVTIKNRVLPSLSYCTSRIILTGLMESYQHRHLQDRGILSSKAPNLSPLSIPYHYKIQKMAYFFDYFFNDFF
jgi:hypothetical protein